MDADALTPSLYIEQHEQRLREEIYEGCRLARELDERVRSIPTGKLSHMVSDQSDAAAVISSSRTTQLRCSIAIATADVVAAFNKSIKLLLQSSDCTWPDYSTALSAASSPLQTALGHAQKATHSCVPSVKAITKSPPHSPPGRHVKAPSGAAAHCKQQSNVMASASPTSSEMSDGSPKQKALNICRKRKLQPKVALKMPAGNAETAESNTPPDDGHTWRKYGQKNILGAQYPRSYYRCTHKSDTGCSALKQVQRCDEDDSFFDVVYKGYHTCRSAELDKECWPLAFPQGLSSMLHFPNRSTTLIPPAAASLMLANMSAANANAKQSSTHHANLDNLLCHVVSVASSDGLRIPDLSGAHSSSVIMNPPSWQALLNGSTHGPGNTLFRNSSAAIQDESASKEQLRGKSGKGGEGCQLYAEEQGRAVNPLEVWAGFENNNGEMYKTLAYVDDNAHDADRRPYNIAGSNSSRFQKQDDDAANSALPFDTLDTVDDDLLIGYLNP